jgi:hypothetical protein
MYWFLGKKSKLSLGNKLLLYKQGRIYTGARAQGDKFPGAAY